MSFSFKHAPHYNNSETSDLDDEFPNFLQPINCHLVQKYPGKLLSQLIPHHHLNLEEIKLHPEEEFIAGILFRPTKICLKNLRKDQQIFQPSLNLQLLKKPETSQLHQEDQMMAAIS